MTLDNRHRPDKSGHERCLSVFSRNLDERFVVSAAVGAFVVESKQVVCDKDFPRFKDERFPQQRTPFKVFALRVNQCRLHDVDRQIRIVAAHFQILAFQISHEALARCDDFSAGHNRSVDYILRVLDGHCFESLSHRPSTALPAAFQAHPLFSFALLRGSNACIRQESGRDHASRREHRDSDR